MPGLFQDTYQDGASLTLYEAKVASAKSSAKIKWQFEGQKPSIVVWDPILSSNVIHLENVSPKAQMVLSHRSGLCIHQRCLCVQTLVKPGDHFGMDLQITDTDGLMHKLYLSTSYRETTIHDHSLHSKVAIRFRRPGHWTNLVIDLEYLIRGLFKSTKYRTLDSISIRGSCAIKRIFTLKNRPPDDFGSDSLDLESHGPLQEIPPRLQMNCRSGSTAVTQHVSLALRHGSGSSTDSAGRGHVLGKPHIAFGSRYRRDVQRMAKSSLAASPQASPLDMSGHEEDPGHVTSSRTGGSAVDLLVDGTPAHLPIALRSESEMWASTRPKKTSKPSPTGRSSHVPGVHNSPGHDDVRGTSIPRLDIGQKPISRHQGLPTKTQADASNASSMNLYHQRRVVGGHSSRGYPTSSMPDRSVGHAEVAAKGGSALGRPTSSVAHQHLARASRSELNSRMESLSRQGFKYQYQADPTGIVGQPSSARSMALKPFPVEDVQQHNAATVGNEQSTNSRPTQTNAGGPASVELACKAEESVRVSVSRLEQHNELVSQQSSSVRAEEWMKGMEAMAVREDECNAQASYGVATQPGAGLIGEDGSYLLPDFPSRVSEYSTVDSEASSSMSWLQSCSGVLQGVPFTSKERSEFNIREGSDDDDEIIILAENPGPGTQPLSSEATRSFSRQSTFSNFSAGMSAELIDVLGDLGDTLEAERLEMMMKAELAKVDHETEPPPADGLDSADAIIAQIFAEPCGHWEEVEDTADGSSADVAGGVRDTLAPGTEDDVLTNYSSPEVSHRPTHSSPSDYAVNALSLDMPDCRELLVTSSGSESNIDDGDDSDNSDNDTGVQRD